MPATVARIASAMGYAIRSQENEYADTALKEGTTWTTDTVLRVDWRWIALPAISVGLAVGFVAAAAVVMVKV